MPDKHALLSPSAAHRWLYCPAAPRLEATMPEESSSYADEGTLAHAYAARRLKRFLGEETAAEDEEIDELAPSYLSSEMPEYVDVYCDAVLRCYSDLAQHDITTVLMVEQRLSFDPVVPESFGTSDAIVYGNGELHVFDLKYGKGIEVSAVNNPQMKIYALGATRITGHEGAVTLHIVQPRLGNISEWPTTTGELWSWAYRELEPAAKRAFRGTSAAQAGEWCRFCRVKGCCRALSDYCTGMAMRYSTPALLDAGQMAAALASLDTVRTWLTAIEDYTLKEALNGTEYPGYKLVEASSRRCYTDVAKAATALRAAGYDDATIFKPQELLGITDMERTLGRAAFADVLGKYIGRSKGKPKLVPADDRRPAFYRNSAADDFAGIED